MIEPKRLSIAKLLMFSVLLALMVGVVLALMLYAAEAYLAYEEYDIERGTGLRMRRAAEKAGVVFDGRQTAEVVEDLRKQGKEAYPFLSPGVFVDSDGVVIDGKRIMPLAGVSRAPTVFCNETGQWIVYDSDEHGFNNPVGSWRRGEVDLAIVGSSFIQGACLKPGEDIAAQLRKRGLRTLNVGMGGSGPLVHNAMVKEYLEFVQPKVVIFSLYAVNIRDPVYEQVSPTLMKYLNNLDFSQHLSDRQEEVDEMLKEYLSGAYEKRLADLAAQRQERRQIITERLIREGLGLTKLRERLRNFGGRDVVTEGREEQKLALFERVLLSTRQKVEKWGGKLIFMYLPDWYSYAERYDTYGIKIGPNFLLRQDVLAIVQKHNIPIIDVQSDVFEKQHDPVSLWNFRMFGHYTLAGYTLISNRISDFLRSTTALRVN